MMRCEFGLCQRGAEFEVTLGPDIVPVNACGLHVTPVATWGVVNVDDIKIVLLRTSPAA